MLGLGRIFLIVQGSRAHDQLKDKSCVKAAFGATKNHLCRRSASPRMSWKLACSEKVEAGIPETEGVRGALVLGPGERPIEGWPPRCDELGRAGDPGMEWRGCEVGRRHPRLVLVREHPVPHALEPSIRHRL